MVCVPTFASLHARMAIAAVCLFTTPLLVTFAPGCNDDDSGGGGAAGGGAAGGAGGEGGAIAMGGGGSGGTLFGSGGQGGAPAVCEKPAAAAGEEVALAAEYQPYYEAFALGPVPGVPDKLGGCVVKHDDPNTLLIVGTSETQSAKIYSIGLKRGPCGHIIGFKGSAQPVADTPYADANLVYAPGNLLFYTQWPQFKLSQLPAGATVPAVDTDFVALGMVTQGDSGPGGLGLVPPPLAAAGEMRTVSWPAGYWYHVTLTPDGNGLFNVPSITQTQKLDYEPGGFAYVPAGSPGFATQSVIMAEWRTGQPSLDRVSTYQVDQQGDPLPASRKEFFTKFPRPWGAYFEPVTGDYLFLTWGATPPDRIYIVQGFLPPPPIPN